MSLLAAVTDENITIKTLLFQSPLVLKKIARIATAQRLR